MTAEANPATTLEAGWTPGDLWRVFESTNDGITITTLDGRLIEANPAMCAMHGYTLDEFKALPPGSYVHTDYHALRAELRRGIANGVPYRLRAKDVRKDGTAFDVEVLGTPMTFRGELHVLAVVRDVSDQVLAEQLLEQDVEQRTRELAALLDLTRDTASMLELEPLLERVMDRLRLVVDYDAVAINHNVGESSRILARRGPGSVTAGARMPGRRVAAFRERYDKGEAVVIDDVRGPGELAEGYRQMVGDLLDSGFSHVQSYMSALLRGRGGIFGSITVSWNEKAHYTAEDGRLLVAFADQVALAIENARLFDDEQKRARETEALLTVARNTASMLELEPLLESILDQLGSVLAHSAVAISLFDNEGWNTVARRGPQPAQHQGPPPRRNWSAFDRWVRAGEPFIIDDVRGESELAASYREQVGDMLDVLFTHVQCYMAAPMRGRNGAFGVLTVSWHEPNYYTAEHSRLLLAFADHVAIAIENARLFNESQRREKELETLLEVARATSELSDVPTALERLMTQLGLMMQFTAVSVVIFEGGDGVIVSRQGPGTVGAGTPIRGAATSPIAEMLENNDILIIGDARDDSELATRWRATIGDEIYQRFEHVRSWMGAALRDRNGLRGILTVSWPEPRFYSENDGRVLAAFAGHAAVAFENARLFDDSQRRAREMEALYTADAALHRSLRLDDVLEAMVNVAVDVVGGDQSTILIRDADSGYLTVRASRNLPPAAVARANADLAQVPLERDARARPRYVPNVLQDRAELKDLIRASEVSALAELPIVVEGRVLGYFHIAFNEEREFGSEDRRLFEALASRAALAIQNAQLYERAQQTASLEERQRLARELHDSVSQALYGIALGARTARKWLDRDPERVREPLDYALGLAEVGLAEMRALIFELRPESLEAEGLVVALGRHVNAIGARYEVEVLTDFGDEPELKPHVREALYRIAQEAVHNVVKHAQAKHIWVSVHAQAGATALAVRDDGNGFDPGGDFHGHLGLKSMRERAERLGGTLELHSAPGSGTEVRVSVPLA